MSLRSWLYLIHIHCVIGTMNESPLIISNTVYHIYNLIALTNAFIKKKTELSYIDLRKDKQP